MRTNSFEDLLKYLLVMAVYDNSRQGRAIRRQRLCTETCCCSVEVNPKLPLSISPCL